MKHIFKHLDKPVCLCTVYNPNYHDSDAHARLAQLWVRDGKSLISEKQVQELAGMGFSEGQARAALKLSHGDLQAAVEVLVSVPFL